MPHSPDDKKRAINRLRRIKGQAEALELAVAQGADCGALLQQIAALRGAATGLMAEVLESHLRETFLEAGRGGGTTEPVDGEAEIDGIMRIIRSYLK
ncbi:MAG: metal/formaldehyde-sensitive transcriptional repressor [Chelatococcus sp.]|uniref:metal/formaldehyde-sensitive transcriptional repressor n=1 Tax=unclassified Chelatococcus TaxID=2638111 RepID=UPI001BCB0685|nr:MULTISPECIES: metal/formaldehyde-sensitive transcriptional repressor [unclassified Chelatococcus]MBS7739933.1 metal/formaldehyde-sensitive transcriptional repressor [Chelatococcus sp. HY11]MBX3536632.1 metal/formaldehyde-sensitive transcriptional repressor [Chelatococcus sp.]MBX3545637.1 metal/formaldehyde-sensitive transcriptional repressor [Chelatococcus sp.]MCO5078767.1 metal/formaldehyde-sensitive transcriptional repressor [Chelatococcus sp.]